jgi:hypothetical protein
MTQEVLASEETQKCILEKLCDMSKTHKHIVDEKKSNICVKENYLKNLTIILETL